VTPNNSANGAITIKAMLLVEVSEPLVHKYRFILESDLVEGRCY
jgi:hypothetical protein